MRATYEARKVGLRLWRCQWLTHCIGLLGLASAGIYVLRYAPRRRAASLAGPGHRRMTHRSCNGSSARTTPCCVPALESHSV